MSHNLLHAKRLMTLIAFVIFFIIIQSLIFLTNSDIHATINNKEPKINRKTQFFQILFMLTLRVKMEIIMRELLLPLVLLVLGACFFIAGYLIAIKRRFDLMNGYYVNKRKYINHTAFALRHGLIELTGGGLMILFGAFCSFYRLTRPSFVIAFLGTIIILLLLKLNRVFSRKNF